MDHRPAKLEIELNSTGVALPTFSDFELVQVVRDYGRSFTAGETDLNVG
jgi:hypothetical protein